MVMYLSLIGQTHKDPKRSIYKGLKKPKSRIEVLACVHKGITECELLRATAVSSQYSSQSSTMSDAYWLSTFVKST